MLKMIGHKVLFQFGSKYIGLLQNHNIQESETQTVHLVRQVETDAE